MLNEDGKNIEITLSKSSLYGIYPSSCCSDKGSSIGSGGLDKHSASWPSNQKERFTIIGGI